MIRPETEAAWPSEDVSKLGGFPGRSPKSLVDMQSAMEEKNKRLICLKEAPLKEEELIGGRLYTGPLFIKYNSVLRGVDSTSDFLQTQFISLCCAKEVGERFEKSDKSSTDFSAAKAHATLYTSTLHAINSSIVKMSKLTRARYTAASLTRRCPPSFGRRTSLAFAAVSKRRSCPPPPCATSPWAMLARAAPASSLRSKWGWCVGHSHTVPRTRPFHAPPSRRWTAAQNSSGCRSTHTRRRFSSGRSPALRCCRFALTVKPGVDGPL